MSIEPDFITNDSELAVQQAMNLLRMGKIQLARKQAEAVLQETPEEIDCQLIIAAANRAQGDCVQAIQGLKDLLFKAPNFALAQQELGFAYADAGQVIAGIKALQRAVKINPKLATSWQKMGELFLVDGDEVSAAEAFKRHLLLSSHDPELINAVSLFSAGKIAHAEQACRLFLKKNPSDITAIRLLAEIGLKVGALNDALHLLERCLILAPEFDLARLTYAHVLNKSDKLEQALVQVNQLLDAKPNEYPLLVLQASILVKFGDCQPALACYEKLLSNYTPQPKIALSYAHALKTSGKAAEAIVAYRLAISLQASFGEAYWSLANLKTFKFEDDDIVAMRDQIESQNCTEVDNFHLCFALGKALEEREQYRESFLYYQRGNRIKEKLEVYDPENTENIVKRQKMTCSAELLSAATELGCQSPIPIFIVGLPRSGSTLLEQILATHSQVDGTKELGHIIGLARRLGGKKKHKDVSRYPEVLAELSAEQLSELGEEYIKQTAIQRGAAPFFIDKMPNNFLHIGLIKLILPNAKIIDARRHPMASGFSGYKQLFAKGQAFTYSQANIGRYYGSYVDVMDHWDRVLPGKVLRVQYEEVVADIEQQVRRILDFCGLPFEAGCLEFYNNQRPVRTASSEQVRQPIYSAGLEHWRHYEPYLDELKQNLGSVLSRYPLS
ncbi:sulfotransferase [Dasania marina]|uniref:tetratricopeptide repeat-containing sulfotransferase family protein n=1 Tax=Dasania marina TaxID=471499 RepID=UPI0030DA08BD|tara:strand:- start:60493 stop:62505 length:2013 start_codon:yes stop_codon:yes gene_type:complete